MVRITSVRCLEGFTVELGFTDGTRRTLDLDSIIRGTQSTGRFSLRSCAA